MLDSLATDMRLLARSAEPVAALKRHTGYDARVRRVLDHRDHNRQLDRNRYVYAVVSRRAGGLSVGINMNPDKVCNFACPYCQVDRTVPGGSPVVERDALVAELEQLVGLIQAGTLWETPPFDTVAPDHRRVVDIAFAGDGEPTSPPGFPPAARAVREVRDRHSLAVPLRVLTNATLFHKRRVHEALSAFDELWCKLDAGSEPYFRLVDGAHMPFKRVLDNLLSVARERPIVIQSLFMAFDGSGPETAEIDAYIGRLRHMLAEGGQVDRVQVYTVARRPADARVTALGHAVLEGIAERVRTLDLPVEVHGAGGPEPA